MSGRSWLVDGNRIATKIKSACHPERVKWESNPSRACPNCQHIIDNSDVSHEWPGLPRGVKFDPTDQEIVWHLLAKSGKNGASPHPFIEEFIPTVNNESGICYTHPKNLPGAKKDGSSSHFFHRAIKAYNSGTRKRRKIQDDDSGDVRWHKTGRTKPVLLDGVHVGNKKIMVLYMSINRGKSEKTNWVMHQYHLGTDEDEQDGEYVISKIFLQQLQGSKSEKNDGAQEDVCPITPKVDPLTPKSVTPEPPEECRSNDFDFAEETSMVNICEQSDLLIDHLPIPAEEAGDDETHVSLECDDIVANVQSSKESDEGMESSYPNYEGDFKWWEGESQVLLDSQQLVEGLSLCDELLQSQPCNDEGDNEKPKSKPRLSDYALLGPEKLKKDLEECQNLEFDPTNIELDTPPEFRLSQLEFGSQDSYFPWGGGR